MFNLMIVAGAGVILRYKIAFPLPAVNQKFLLHAHSHFAFSGWVSQVLMALLVGLISRRSGVNYFRKYRWLLYANLAFSYGMLFSFPFQGYGPWSILFSTLTILVSYGFAILYWKDLGKLPGKTRSQGWIRAALLFHVMSSAGPFSLAYMMASHHLLQNWYLASIYFFLHFQYNGWFFFACMGLLIDLFPDELMASAYLKGAFRLFAIACIPAFLLSVLWWPVSAWLYAVVVASAIAQLAGWGLLLVCLSRNYSALLTSFSRYARVLLVLCAAACTIKLCLQAGSVLPVLSKLAFGFRPIVIGYLHLVLLAVITLFLLSYMVGSCMVRVNALVWSGLGLFTAGIFINEFLLMAQGIYDLRYEALPLINECLFGAAIGLFTGMLVFNLGQLFYKDDPDHNGPTKHMSTL